MKNFLRVFAVVLTTAVVTSFVSCNKKNSSDGNSLVIWHWLTDREPALLELAKKYKESTGVDVQFQLYAPSDNYQQKVRVGAQTANLPDIYGVLGEARDLASFIEAGHVENLDVYLGEGKSSWRSRFYSEALNTASFREGNSFNVSSGCYGIPLDVTTIPMIYNKKLFEKAGLNPDKAPQTWDEFIEAGKKLKASGVSGFVSGWQETWIIYSLFTDLAFNNMGEAKVMDTFRGKVAYTDPQWVEVLAAFEKMQKAGFADSSLVTMGNKIAEQTFASERSGMTFNGSWAVNVYEGMNPELNYVPFLPPAINPKNPRRAWGGAGTIFSVNAKSPKKQMAVDFLKWVSAKEQAAFLVNQTKNLPAVNDVEGDVSPILKGFAAAMENSIHTNRFVVNEEPKVQEIITKGIQSILIGEKSAVQIAADIQKAKEKMKR